MKPTQAQISTQTKIDKMTLSKSIRQLENKNIISRKANTEDGRSLIITFSQKGSEIIKTAISTVEQIDSDYFSCLTKEQLKAFNQLAYKLMIHND